MNILTLAIAALSGLGDIYVELTDGDKKLVVVEDNAKTHIFVVRQTSDAKSTSPIVRVGKVPPDIAGIVAVHVDRKDVWIIPFEDVAGITCIRLGKRWEKYRVTVNVTTDFAIEDAESLKAGAVDAARSVKETK